MVADNLSDHQPKSSFSEKIFALKKKIWQVKQQENKLEQDIRQEIDQVQAKKVLDEIQNNNHTSQQ